ncbi:hypothetical protein BD410DRAFT_608433 [Rickenella mellea]|uniref:Uncharacterized protein n=1 Tax=Rickenella mellea TaxID=50990 RepID=A0A4Y7QDN8_9AGAM|nr:hypothetical protein BD410DRAFT_608433 [Rickenella mellea]
MFATLISATLLSFVAVQAVLASEFTIDTPQLAQCGKASLSWTGGEGPYDVAVVPGDEPCGDPIVELGDHDGLSTGWTVALKEGTKVMLSVIDKNGDEAWSGEITVGGSKDASCLKSTTPSSGSGDGDSDGGSPGSGSGASGTPGYTVVSNTGTASAAGSTGGAVAAGAANAGLIPGSTSGALSARQIPVAVTAFGGIAVALVAFAL